MENKPNKPMIYIGTPHNTLFPYQYLVSFADTYVNLYDKYNIGITMAESALVHVNRNTLIKNAYQDKVDYLIFIDSDIVWTSKDIEALIDFGRPVVSGLYRTRRPLEGMTHAPCVFRKVGRRYAITKEVPETPFKVDAAGMGFFLITREVIEKMVELIPKIGYPFDFLNIKELGCEENDHTGLVGEDLCFCHRLQKVGFDIWVLPSVKLPHLTTAEIRV